MKGTILSGVLAMTALPVSAADLAMIVGNGDYSGDRALSSGELPLRAVSDLEDAGVRVLQARNASSSALRDLAERFEEAADDGEGLVVVLSGRFLSTGQDTYFLPVDRSPDLAAGAAGALELSRRALPVSALLPILGEADGPALLVLATERGDRGTLSDGAAYLTRGLGQLPEDSGVTIVTGTPVAVAGLVTGLTDSGQSIASMVRGTPELTAVGEPPRRQPFLDTGGSSAGEDDRLWEVVRELDTVAAIELYLSRYPSGQHAGEARDRLAYLSDPARQAEATESALGLSGDQRREIQRNLSLLGYNTRGIDGIFGPGTRSAIGRFQEENGFTRSTYLTRDQILRLDDRAAVRAAEIEREDAERRRQREAQDNAFWQDTGEGRDETALRQYLDRYPDGLHSETARDRLAAIEARNRAQADEAENAHWARARSEDDVEGYRRYLEQHPNGRFEETARARIEELRQQGGQENRAAAAEEQALGLNAVTRRLIEQRLEGLGRNPGAVDGEFTDETRRALRQYQSDSGLPTSGYLNEPTVVRLLADSVRSLLD
ncbi:peptidoglycan-binding protein [Mesobaculum littorinae]|uniref:Peptidoglycan-binding protein n=1 Tax=Mesobaculum littorinae TaxID=2486419 RepID=A0A438AHU5_9RHOB|nr:peptidoglycan-binding protein [Mesobaculum littorinae]RVV98195.1 peptidoglycan-binding protein [Mesobaculum littorinae]